MNNWQKEYELTNKRYQQLGPKLYAVWYYGRGVIYGLIYLLGSALILTICARLLQELFNH